MYKRYGDSSYSGHYHDLTIGYPSQMVQFALMPLISADDSEDEKCEAQIESTEVNFYVWGWLESAASGDATISITAGSLALTGGAVTPQGASTETISAGALSLSGAAVYSGTGIPIATGGLNLSGEPSLLNDSSSISTGALNLTGQTVTPSISEGEVISAGTLGLGGDTVTIKEIIPITPGLWTLTGKKLTIAGEAAISLGKQLKLRLGL